MIRIDWHIFENVELYGCEEISVRDKNSYVITKSAFSNPFTPYRRLTEKILEYDLNKDEQNLRN